MEQNQEGLPTEVSRPLIFLQNSGSIIRRIPFGHLLTVYPMHAAISGQICVYIVRYLIAGMYHKIGLTEFIQRTEAIPTSDTFQAMCSGNLEIGRPVPNDNIRLKVLGCYMRKNLLFRTVAIVLAAKVAGKPTIQPKPPTVSLLIGMLAIGEEDQFVSLLPKLIQRCGNAII